MSSACSSTNSDEINDKENCSISVKIEETQSQNPDNNKNLNDSINESDENVLKQTSSQPNVEQPVQQHSNTSNEDTNPLELLKKLETIKEIKNKTIDLQRIKSKLIEEVDCIETETKCMHNFQTELELLIQEKLDHLEVLRQIQDDILNMENTIKQTDEEKKRAIDSALRLHVEYKPLKNQINQLRESIGLEKTDDNEDFQFIESFMSKLQPFSENKQTKSTLNNNLTNNFNRQANLNEKSKQTSNSNITSDTSFKMNLKSPDKIDQFTSSNCSSPASVSLPVFNNLVKFNQNNKKLEQDLIHLHNANNNNSNSAFSNPQNSPFLNSNMPKPPIDLPVQLATVALMAQSLRSQSPTFHNSTSQPLSQSSSDNFNKQFNPFILSQNKSHLEHLQSQSHQQSNQHHQQQQQQQLQSMPPSFRQQPPPMKSCLSCNQQIHRNAPICPLCKAKSRSRNPKKPKKKSNNQSSSMSPPPPIDQGLSSRSISKPKQSSDNKQR